jgi:hypothetical protein
MGTIQAIFEVPKFIEVGLTTGQYQRVGGVIVESGTKQVVAWLRDSQNIGNIVNSVFNNLNPLKLIFEAGETALKLYDGHLTRDIVNELGQQVQQNHLEIVNALSMTQRSLHSLTGMVLLTSTGHIVNLAVSTATFAIIIKKLDKLSNDIEDLRKLIKAEFQRNRDIEFKKALQAARDAFDGQGKLRESATRSAIDGLFEAREHFFHDFDKSIENGAIEDNLLLAHQYLLRSIYAEISRVRCYLVSEDRDLARKRLSEDINLLRERVQHLIGLWLGENPAIYFHKDVSSANLDRFLRIQQWMNDVEPHDIRSIFNIIDVMRGDFWNQKLLSSGNILSDFANNFPLPSNNKETRDVKLSKRLSQAEILIENMDRLYGFELEMRTMRLSMDKWNSIVDEAKLNEYGAALLVDTDVAQEQHLAMQKRISAK